ncbi:manganese efflux pump MntP [Paradesulfitobacterium ferrireducens]|uniref:manganese efflux pump MntP n=1 Tax=Paradesulfitobacterium ferrireducens TaxID=2816476 RepID=UPI001A904F81|nr:manganese efflux pump MntP family protein [Paradesulfitobacterium ferrireducens]
MNLAWVLAVSVALGADAFSLAIAIGLVGISKRMIVRLSVLVAIFHVFMPLIGLVAGQTLGLFLGRLARALGAFILIGLGGKMLYHVLRPTRESAPLAEARRLLQPRGMPPGVSLNGYGIYALGFSVSLDALSVGFSLGTLGSTIVQTVLTMGVVAGLMTGTGLVLGRFLGRRAGERAELFGGLALLLIGVKLFF